MHEADCNYVPTPSRKYVCVYDTTRAPAGDCMRCSCCPSSSSATINNGGEGRKEVWSVVAGGATVHKIEHSLHSSIALRATCTAHRVAHFARLALRACGARCTAAGYYRVAPGCMCAAPRKCSSRPNAGEETVPLPSRGVGCRWSVHPVARGACAASSTDVNVGRAVTVASDVSTTCVKWCQWNSTGCGRRVC